MNVLFVNVDSCRRDLLGPYADEPAGFGYAVQTPNLDSFFERAASFHTHYAGSLPCMPARREWLAGTQEFLWRPWGPIEPFDTTLPQVARENDVVSGLVSDHYHYVQHGSDGYVEDFHSFEFVRGHEFDAWRTTPRYPDGTLLAQTTDERRDQPDDLSYMNRVQYARNASEFESEEDFFAPRVFSTASEWIRRNDEWDDWFLFVDSFDVHEPFHCPEPYASTYTDEDPTNPELDLWPYYGRVDEEPNEYDERDLDFVRSQFAGKATMVDTWFGRLLDTLTDLELWEETMVIVTADHGHYLGDHGWVGKPRAPVYGVLARTPLAIWDPTGDAMGRQINALTSAVDLQATVFDALGSAERSGPHSRSLTPLLSGETDHHRDWALYGYWGSSVNVTDGRFTFMRSCDDSLDSRIYSTRMMNAYDSLFVPETPKIDAEADSFLPHTESPVWRFVAESHSRHDGDRLYDTANDPEQRSNLAGDDEPTVERMRSLLETGLDALDAPAYHRERLDLV